MCQELSKCLTYINPFNLHEAGTIMTIPLLQRRKLRHTDAKWLVPSHTVAEWL